MNSIVLQGEITQDPQLRYTSDNQTPIAECVFSFDGTNPNKPSTNSVKLVVWGDRAQEFVGEVRTGMGAIVQGSMRMNTFDRPEGFKEKRASINVSKWFLQEVSSSPEVPDELGERPTSSNQAEKLEPEMDYDEIPF